MGATMRTLGIDRLSVDERMRLVEEIWDSIAAEPEALEIPQSHREELDRRIAAYEAKPQAGSTWEEVEARLAGSNLGKASGPLQRAVAEALTLPEDARDQIAAQIIERIADDRAWDESFAGSQVQLARWAQKARQDVAGGRVRALSRRRP